MSISLAISIIALMISIGTPIAEHIWDRKKAKKEQYMIFFQEICMEYVLKKIPRARTRIVCTQSMKITGIKELRKVLREFRLDMLFFKYEDDKFYSKLCGQFQQLEDLLVKNEDLKIEEIVQYYIFCCKIENCCNDIYKTIIDKFL